MRTVAALYDSRAEAERARGRLISELRAKAPRIIGKDTAAAVDGLKIGRADAESYREGLRRGSYLLVAEVPSGAPAKRIIELLEQSTGAAPDDEAEKQWGDADHGVEVKLPEESQAEPEEDSAPTPQTEPMAIREPQPLPPIEAEPAVAPAPAEEARIPVVEEELRVGKREVVRGGARVRSFTREAPAEERVSLKEEFVEIENRPSERHLSDRDIEAGGLFKDRVFEIAEMREEPVVTKTAVVREEVIVTKRVKERTETIRDTVRHTEVEVEDLAATAPDPPRFFGRGS